MEQNDTTEAQTKKLEAHGEAVKSISARVKHFYSLKKPYRIYHGSTNSTRASTKTADNIIDTSSLNNVLQITSMPSKNDTSPASALVEPNVSMAALVDAAFQQGLVPPVVMEFPGITVGGGFAGTSAESSSFREGIFDRTVTEIEIVLPTSDVVTASPHDPHTSDLFHGAASSFGTLGVITQLRVRLRRAEDYVRLTYQPVSSMREACATIQSAAANPQVHYLDGIMFAQNRGVICTGTLTSHPNSIPIRRFTRPRDPYFYQHVASLPHHAPTTEALPLKDYLFRYDRAGFWVAKYAFAYFHTPLNALTRFLLDPLMRTAPMFHALHKSGLADQYLVQDVAVPLSRAPELASHAHAAWGHYPVWLCPLRVDGVPPLFHRGMAAATQEGGRTPELLLNFGLWGPGSADRAAFVALNRGLEHKVQELGGQKCLYAQVYYTEEEFWGVYDRGRYDALRRKYGAEWLPDVFEKMRVVEKEPGKEGWRARLRRTWPFRGVYAVVHTVLRREYLVRRERRWWWRWRGRVKRE